MNDDMASKDQEETRYSAAIAGSSGNYERAARYDWTGGFLGITQFASDPSSAILNRVLLSPQQVEALVAFMHRHQRTST